MPWLSIVSILSVLLAGLVAAPSASDAQTTHKMAMIMPGPIQDADFNALGYVAVQEVAKAHGIQVAHSESVSVADAERVSREYINSGFDIIAYHGGEYPTVMRKLAGQFPKVAFIQEGSGPMPDPPKNAWVIGRKYYQGFYVLGTLAALATRNDKVGFVGGVRIPDVISSINAVHQALKDHNPKASLVYNVIGDFNDPVKGRQTAEAQIASGADFLVTFINLGLYGVAEAAKAAPKQPVLVNTLYTNKWDTAPQNMAVSLLFDFAKPYKEIVGHIVKGEVTGYYEMRPGSGMELGEMRHVPAEVQKKVHAVFQEVVAGKSLPEISDKTP